MAELKASQATQETKPTAAAGAAAVEEIKEKAAAEKKASKIPDGYISTTAVTTKGVRGRFEVAAMSKGLTAPEYLAQVMAEIAAKVTVTVG